MASKRAKNGFFRFILKLIILGFDLSGYVIKHASIWRSIVMLSSLALSVYLGNNHTHNSDVAIYYFIASEICYILFISLVLSENGLRKRFVKKWGEEKGYLIYEGILGFIFYHNFTSIGYVSSSSPGNLFDFVSPVILTVVVAIMFFTGFTVKVWSAWVVGVDIYYWKDMFLGKKISDFVVVGPYKYIRNPMYGIGQIQAYAVAIWYQSENGLIAAAVNQICVFSFFYMVEKPFIKRVYHT